jgi:hypothetical protein
MITAFLDNKKVSSVQKTQLQQLIQGRLTRSSHYLPPETQTHQLGGLSACAVELVSHLLVLALLEWAVATDLEITHQAATSSCRHFG